MIPSRTVYTSLRNAVLGLAAKAGYHVERICPTHTDSVALLAQLRRYGVDLVLDVGANRGQYAQELIDCGYRGRIVSVEPLSDPYEQLRRAAASHPQWDLADRCCIGDREGEVEVHISANSVASSVLPLAESMGEHSPEAAYTGSETVPMVTLDAIADRSIGRAERPFLKVDVQGYEQQVLAGAEKTLPRIVGLQVELSFVELYEGQQLFTDMLRWIEAQGFVAHRLIPSFIEAVTGRWLQADVVVFRDTLPSTRSAPHPAR